MDTGQNKLDSTKTMHEYQYKTIWTVQNNFGPKTGRIRHNSDGKQNYFEQNNKIKKAFFKSCYLVQAYFWLEVETAVAIVTFRPVLIRQILKISTAIK